MKLLVVLPSFLSLFLTLLTRHRVLALSEKKVSPLLPKPISRPKNIIIDSDLLSFTDDVGALAIANTLQNLGVIHILGIVADVQSRYAVPAMDAINTWYCNPNIPFAQSKPVTNQTSEDNATTPEYITTLANPALFPEDVHDGNNKTILDPLEFYRNILQNAERSSVTIIEIGSLTHLNELYQSPGGKELIAEKVEELIVQGGDFGPNLSGSGPNSAGFNMLSDLQASKVLEDWPSPVTFLPDPVGENVQTGQVLENTPENNPIRVASEIFNNSTNINGASWDILTTYYAIFGIHEGSFEYGNEGGKIRIFDNGTASWDFGTEVPRERRQNFLGLRESNVTVGSQLDKLLAFYGTRNPECNVY